MLAKLALNLKQFRFSCSWDKVCVIHTDFVFYFLPDKILGLSILQTKKKNVLKIAKKTLKQKQNFYWKKCWLLALFFYNVSNTFFSCK